MCVLNDFVPNHAIWHAAGSFIFIPFVFAIGQFVPYKENRYALYGYLASKQLKPGPIQYLVLRF